MKLFPLLLVVINLFDLSFVAGLQPPEPLADVPGRDGSSHDVSAAEKGKEEDSRTRRLMPDLSVTGLVHLYTGDESDAADLVGGATGTVGSETRFVAGQNGLSFEFDGTASSLVSLPVNINPAVFPKFTMGFWVKLRTIGGSNAWGLTNDNGQFDRAIILDDDRFGGVAGGIGSTYASTLPRISTSVWHCVAVAYDDTTAAATVYYDGLTQTIVTSVGTGSTAASLGGNVNFVTDYVDGQIDEVFMFNRFLSESQISTVCDELANPNRGSSSSSKPACFSGQMNIQVKGKGTIRMHQLKIGDKVLTADGTFSKVYSFGHYAPEASTEYLQVQTASMDKQNQLEISTEHLIYIQDKVTKSTHLVSGGDLNVGDYLMMEMGLSSEILSIGKVHRKGAYLPLTTTGTLVVNGVQVSSYVMRDWLKAHFSGDSLHNFLHGATLPVRFICSLMDCADETYDDITGFSTLILFLFRIEEWLLGMPSIARCFFLAFLAVPALLITLLGKFLSMPTTVQVIHIFVAITGYFVLKHGTRNRSPDKRVVKN